MAKKKRGRPPGIPWITWICSRPGHRRYSTSSQMTWWSADPFTCTSQNGEEDESHAITPSDAVGLILLLIPSLPTTSSVSSFAVSSQSHGTTIFPDAKKLPMAQCDEAPVPRAWTHEKERGRHPGSCEKTLSTLWCVQYCIPKSTH